MFRRLLRRLGVGWTAALVVLMLTAVIAGAAWFAHIQGQGDVTAASGQSIIINSAAKVGASPAPVECGTAKVSDTEWMVQFRQVLPGSYCDLKLNVSATGNTRTVYVGPMTIEGEGAAVLSVSAQPTCGQTIAPNAGLDVLYTITAGDVEPGQSLLFTLEQDYPVTAPVCP